MTRYTQEKKEHALSLMPITARHGVPIARSMLAAWIGRLGVALQPLSDRLAAVLPPSKPCWPR